MLFGGLRNRLLYRLLTPPVRVRHYEYSMILSLDDEPHKPTPELLRFAMDSAKLAADTQLADLSARLPSSPDYPQTWPGEHYRLLAAMVRTCKPRLVIEIGTAQGLSALALQKFLPPGGKIVTFDLTPWKQYPDVVLTESDFADGTLRQEIADLGDLPTARRYRELLQQADLFFIDAAKDGSLERRLLENFRAIGLPKKPWLVFDDIRVWKMLAIWREIELPKLDLTSFGHWSGTGVVAWR